MTVGCYGLCTETKGDLVSAFSGEDAQCKVIVLTFVALSKIAKIRRGLKFARGLSLFHLFGILSKNIKDCSKGSAKTPES